MTTANKITIGRILFVPVFISAVIFYGRTELDGYRVMAILVFALTSISDAVDGYIARHYNQKSELGAILDPLADKLLVSAGFIMLTGLGIVPAFITAIIVFRDFFVNALRMFGSDNQKDVSAGLSGKIKTLFQMLSIVFALLSYSMMPTMGIGSFMSNSLDMSILELIINVAMSVTLIFALIATIWSFVDYFLRFKEDIDVEN